VARQRLVIFMDKIIKMIAITGCPKSQYYSSICLDAWSKLGYEVEWFEASIPDTIKDLCELTFAENKWSGYAFTPTEKAIWYSHYRLWKTVEEPTYIIEHDTYPMNRLPEFSDKPCGIFSCFPRNPKHPVHTPQHGHGSGIAPCSGYYLTPETARTLIKNIAKKHDCNVDAYVHDQFRKLLNIKDSEFVEYYASISTCFQIYNHDIGASAEHNIIKRDV